EVAHAGPVEHPLHEDAACDELSEQQASGRERRQERVGKGVAREGGPASEPLAPRNDEERLTANLQEVRPQQPVESGERREAERDSRQAEVLDRVGEAAKLACDERVDRVEVGDGRRRLGGGRQAPLGPGQNLELLEEDDQEDEREPERRCPEPEERQSPDRSIDHWTPPVRCCEREQNGRDEAEQERVEAELDTGGPAAAAQWR